MDLERSRQVTAEEGKDLANCYDAKFIETSAGLEHNVDELLVGVLKQILLRLETGPRTLRLKVPWSLLYSSSLTTGQCRGTAWLPAAVPWLPSGWSGRFFSRFAQTGRVHLVKTYMFYDLKLRHCLRWVRGAGLTWQLINRDMILNYC